VCACRPFLVVAPVSVVANWASELQRFAPEVRVLRYDGNRGIRERHQQELTAHIMAQPAAQRRDPSLPFSILLTTYETVLSDWAFLGRFRWRLAVIDGGWRVSSRPRGCRCAHGVRTRGRVCAEAHRLKNVFSATYDVLKSKYAVARYLLVTGTPVQNNYAELFAVRRDGAGAVQQRQRCLPSRASRPQMLSLAAPTVFPITQAESFVKQLSGDKSLLSPLHKILSVLMLRRTVAEVPELSECAVDA
jgi:SNF2 family DNA or RNA helicase